MATWSTCRRARSCAPAGSATSPFSSPSAPAAGTLHVRAPTATWRFSDFTLSPEQWDSLQIPVSVAFFFLNSTLERVAAFYPGPAGATESELPLDTWAEITRANPQLGTLEPDVEAFLVRAHPNRGGVEVLSSSPSTPVTNWSATCARLWRGFDGGQEAERQDGRLLRRRPPQGADDHALLRSHLSSQQSLRRRAHHHAAPVRVRGGRRVQHPRAGAPMPNPHRTTAPALLSRRGGAPLRDVRRERPSGAIPSRPFLWTHVSRPPSGNSMGPPGFDLPVECTYDFDVAGAKYLRPWPSGDVPCSLLFSGTVFTRGDFGLRGRTPLLVARGLPQASGGGMAGHDGPLLPQQRLDPPPGAAPSATLQRFRTPTGVSPRGTRPSSSCSRKPARTGHERRRRRPLRHRPRRRPTPCSTRSYDALPYRASLTR